MVFPQTQHSTHIHIHAHTYTHPVGRPKGTLGLSDALWMSGGPSHGLGALHAHTRVYTHTHTHALWGAPRAPCGAPRGHPRVKLGGLVAWEQARKRVQQGADRVSSVGSPEQWAVVFRVRDRLRRARRPQAPRRQRVGGPPPNVSPHTAAASPTRARAWTPTGRAGSACQGGGRMPYKPPQAPQT